MKTITTAQLLETRSQVPITFQLDVTSDDAFGITEAKLTIDLEDEGGQITFEAMDLVHLLGKRGGLW